MNKLLWEIRNHDWIGDDGYYVMKMIRDEQDIKVLQECLNYIPKDFSNLKSFISTSIVELQKDKKVNISTSNKTYYLNNIELITEFMKEYKTYEHLNRMAKQLQNTYQEFRI